LMKIITEVRGFIAQGYVKLEKFDPELHIPENIEEILSNMSSGFAADVIVIKGGNADPAHEASHSSPVASRPSVGAASAGDNLGQEVEFFKRKLNQAMSEISALKHENSVLKERLAQIKKIA
jgi:hypothetical protein